MGKTDKGKNTIKFGRRKKENKRRIEETKNKKTKNKAIKRGICIKKKKEF